MKLNRRDLRRLIESVINEENPGSKFAAAEKKGEKNKSDALRQEATQELQKTYDWFIDTVFPAIESDKWPIVADDNYGYITTIDLPNTRGNFGPYDLEYVEKGTRWESLDSFPKMKAGPKADQPGNTLSLANVYNLLERSVINNNLRVTMQSEQPDEFEEEVAKAKKDNPPSSQVNESLSRGSLYRRRYHGRY